MTSRRRPIKILILLLLTQLLAQSALADQSVLCDTIFDNQISFSNSTQTRNSREFSVITWNAHKFADKNFVPDLIQLSHDADMILIQEAMHSTELQNLLLSQFDFSFSFNKSFCTADKQATGVMNASRYPLLNNSTLVSPDTEPVSFTPKVSGYSVINVPEIGIVHIINTHGLNFNLGSPFERQINEITKFISKLQGPVIWAGDFNTWSGGRQKYLDKKSKALGLIRLKPNTDNRVLKLDHIYMRGFELINIQILDNIESSDHFPVKAIFKKI